MWHPSYRGLMYQFYTNKSSYVLFTLHSTHIAVDSRDGSQSPKWIWLNWKNMTSWRSDYCDLTDCSCNLIRQAVAALMRISWLPQWHQLQWTCASALKGKLYTWIHILKRLLSVLLSRQSARRWRSYRPSSQVAIIFSKPRLPSCTALPSPLP